MEGFETNTEIAFLAKIDEIKSRDILDERLRNFLDSFTRDKTFRKSTAEFLMRIEYIKLKQIAPNPQTGYNSSVIIHPPPASRNDLMTPEWARHLPYLSGFMESSIYIKLKHIAPSPQKGFHHPSIVPPAPATREEMMTSAWSKYLPDIPESKTALSSFPIMEKEKTELREKSDNRNKIWHQLFYKKDYSKTENETGWYNVMKKYRPTKSLHDIILSRKVRNDVTGSPVISSYSA
ncbi:uncharacterized protein [Argopecten irradians]|uniref:uncharacterized protein isoform X1 n=1 Tax=Argopecten irradians TaxID=31199 RepID=UPI003711846F